MIERKIKIINKLGLHARASGKLLETTTKYTSEIQLIFNGQSADAKNIMALLLLGAGFGSEITLKVSGNDEQSACDAVIALFNNRFGESE